MGACDSEKGGSDGKQRKDFLCDDFLRLAAREEFPDEAPRPGPALSVYRSVSVPRAEARPPGRRGNPARKRERLSRSLERPRDRGSRIASREPIFSSPLRPRFIRHCNEGTGNREQGTGNRHRTTPHYSIPYSPLPCPESGFRIPDSELPTPCLSSPSVLELVPLRQTPQKMCPLGDGRFPASRRESSRAWEKSKLLVLLRRTNPPRPEEGEETWNEQFRC